MKVGGWAGAKDLRRGCYWRLSLRESLARLEKETRISYFLVAGLKS
jgi:hypothetical protein